MAVVRKTESAFQKLDEDVYLAKIVSIDEAVPKAGGDPYLQWHFLVKDAAVGGVVQVEPGKIMGMTSLKLSKGSTFDKWATILLGRQIEIDEDIDTDDFVGKPVRIVVKNVPNKKTGDMQNKVVELLVAKRTEAPAPKQEEAKPAPAPVAKPAPAPAKKTADLFDFS
jgi:hypothetical protein